MNLDDRSDGGNDTTIGSLAIAIAWALPRCRRVPVPPIGVDRFVEAAIHQRVTGLALSAADAGALADWPVDTRSRLVDAHLEALRTTLAIEALCVRTTDELAAHRIRHAVLKGCATSHLDYPDPAFRVTGDVDILIARRDHGAALGALEGIGLHRAAPPFRAGWERRYGKDIVISAGEGLDVDLHLALVEGYFGIRMPTAPLLDRATAYRIAGRSIAALDAAGRLLHAAIHTATSTPVRLASAADVIQITASGDPSTGDAAAQLPQLAAELGVDALVARGVARAWALFEAEPSALSEWAQRHRPSRDEQRALLAFDTLVGEPRWRSGLGALPVWKRPVYLLPLVVPSRAHLRSRNRSYRQHLRMSVRRLRRPPS